VRPAGLNNEPVGLTTGAGCGIILGGILVVLICGSKETAVVPVRPSTALRPPGLTRPPVLAPDRQPPLRQVTYMVQRWSEAEFLYYAIPMGIFTVFCNGALFHYDGKLAKASKLAKIKAKGFVLA
jgi:hypothetical protein